MGEGLPEELVLPNHAQGVVLESGVAKALPQAGDELLCCHPYQSEYAQNAAQ